MTEDCESKYTCLKSGVVVAEHMSCNIDETCGVQNGVRRCYPKQCTVGTNGVFSTFNGRTGQVTTGGPYDLVQMCDDSQTDDWFRVGMDVQACGKSGHMTAVGIYAFFDGASIMVNSKFETLVSLSNKTVPLLNF